MTKALAKDLIAKKGIRVNAVAPGPIWTPIPVESFSEDMARAFPDCCFT
jgi:NAD(P)-dependent dehydrogenase (short-subunit alcohol dehydrogenase family)